MNTVGKIYLDALGGLPGAGAIPAELMIVGLAPSTKRPPERHLEPFGASSWNLIKNIVKDSPSLFITNLIKSPMDPGTKVKISDVRRWIPALEQELAFVKPRRILAVGKAPAVALCPGFVSMREDHGAFFRNPVFNTIVVPTFHFAAAFRDRRLLPFLQNDLRRFFTLPDPEPSKYKMIEDVEALPWEKFVGKRLFLDLESTGVSMADEVTMLGLTWEGSRVVYIKEKPTPQWLLKLYALIARSKNQVIGHNLAFDIAMMSSRLSKPFPRSIPVEDTMLMAHTAGEEVLSLKHLTSFHTDLPGSHFGGGFKDPLYLAEDVRSTAAIYKVFEPARKTFIHRLLSSLVPTIAQMRVRGVYIDHKRLNEIAEQTEKEVSRLERELMKANRGKEFNPRSSEQVAQFLIRGKVKLTEKTEAGAWSVSEKVLVALAEQYPDNPAMKLLLEYRAVSKLDSGFIMAYRKFSENDGLLHPNLKLYGTRTGRPSCSDPNLQQVPREGPLKQIFVPRPGFEAFCLCDLSQAELRVAALTSDDDLMVEALLSEDVHRRIASIVFKKSEKDITAQERKWSKRITFGIIYGGSAYGLSFTSGLPEHEVAAIIKMLRREFKGLNRWLIRSKTQAVTAKYVETVFGRRRSLVGVREQEGAGGAYRKLVNTPVQSVASDLILIIMHVVKEELVKRKMKSFPLFTVHDSLAIEIANGESDEIPELLELGFKTLNKTPITKFRLFKYLPIVGDMALGSSWAACESTNEKYDPRVCYSFSTHAPMQRTKKK